MSHLDAAQQDTPIDTSKVKVGDIIRIKPLVVTDISFYPFYIQALLGSAHWNVTADAIEAITPRAIKPGDKVTHKKGTASPHVVIAVDGPDLWVRTANGNRGTVAAASYEVVD